MFRLHTIVMPRSVTDVEGARPAAVQDLGLNRINRRKSFAPMQKRNLLGDCA
jgi:hypothetical protein